MFEECTSVISTSAVYRVLKPCSIVNWNLLEIWCICNLRSNLLNIVQMYACSIGGASALKVPCFINLSVFFMFNHLVDKFHHLLE